MVTFTDRVSLNYDQVNLLAQTATVDSRKQIKIEGWRIVVSAMTSIIGPKFIKACAALPEDYQPTIHVPRDIFQDENIKLLCDLEYPPDRIFVGVGLKTTEEQLQSIPFKTLLLDVANGYLPSVAAKAKELSEKGFTVCTGSVHTQVGLWDLAKSGVSIVRSGIAPGSVCITKDSTGFTRGTITELVELDEARNTPYKQHIKILADGGIKTPADVVKAFSAGADYVMTGRLFVQALECRMHNNEERLDWMPKSVYYGMASKLGKMSMGIKLEDIDNIEGKVEVIGGDLISLEAILKTVWAGIRSGVSYSGYSSIKNMIGNGVFEIKH